MKQQIKVFLFMKKKTHYRVENHEFEETTTWEPEPWSVRVSDDEERIFINEQMVEIDAPDDFDPVPKQVAALEAEKRKAMDEYQAKVADINERLSKLQAIEYAP